MRSLILPESLLCDMDQNKLREAGINFEFCLLESPYEGTGLIIKESDLTHAFQVIGLNMPKIRMIETQDSSLYLIQPELNIYDGNNKELCIQYAQLVKGRLSEDLRQIEESISKCEQVIERLSDEIFTHSRALFEEKAKIHHLRLYAVEMTNRLLDNFELLSNHPKVSGLSVEKGTLTVTTEPIHAVFQDIEIRLGRYIIDVSPDNKFPCFSATSESQIRRINGRDYIHPLIPADNKLNLERFMPIFAQLIGEWNFSQVILLSINILNNVGSEPNLLRWRK